MLKKERREQIQRLLLVIPNLEYSNNPFCLRVLKNGLMLQKHILKTNILSLNTKNSNAKKVSLLIVNNS